MLSTMSTTSTFGTVMMNCELSYTLAPLVAFPKPLNRVAAPASGDHEVELKKDSQWFPAVFCILSVMV